MGQLVSGTEESDIVSPTEESAIDVVTENIAQVSDSVSDDVTDNQEPISYSEDSGQTSILYWTLFDIKVYLSKWIQF